MESNKKWNNILTYSLVVITIILMVQNFLLVQRNQDYLKKIQLFQSKSEQPYLLKEGKKFPRLISLNLDSVSVVLEPSNNRTKKFFFVFSTTCFTCLKNMEEWQRIINDFRNRGVEFVGVSTDSLYQLKEFISHVSVQFPVFSIAYDSSSNIGKQFRIVPQTILVDSVGTVAGAWGGVLNDEKKVEIMKHF